MLQTTATTLETQARAKPNGVHVIRHEEGAIVASVTATTFSSILVDAGSQLEQQIEQARQRLEADLRA